MKYLFSINELFDADSKSDATVIDSKFNSSSMYDGATIDILIKNIPYRFSTQIREFRNGYYIYISYYILNKEKYRTDKDKNFYTDYNFIINNQMTLQVLNTLPLFLKEYKNLLLNKKFNPLITGFYYDADEEKRRNIYEYYFKKRLGNRLENITHQNYILVNLKFPELIQDLDL